MLTTETKTLNSVGEDPSFEVVDAWQEGRKERERPEGAVTWEDRERQRARPPSGLAIH